MKAKINSKGGLEIYAENDIEAFALKLWSEDSIRSERKYTLSIDLVSYERTAINHD